MGTRTPGRQVRPFARLLVLPLGHPPDTAQSSTAAVSALTPCVLLWCAAPVPPPRGLLPPRASTCGTWARPSSRRPSTGLTPTSGERGPHSHGQPWGRQAAVAEGNGRVCGGVTVRVLSVVLSPLFDSATSPAIVESSIRALQVGHHCHHARAGTQGRARRLNGRVLLCAACLAAGSVHGQGPARGRAGGTHRQPRRWEQQQQPTTLPAPPAEAKSNSG